MSINKEVLMEQMGYAIEGLQAIRHGVDLINGNLHYITENTEALKGNDKEGYNEFDNISMFYETFPVWSTIDECIESLERAIDTIKAK